MFLINMHMCKFESAQAYFVPQTLKTDDINREEGMPLKLMNRVVKAEIRWSLHLQIYSKLLLHTQRTDPHSSYE